ncbi:MAG: AI-2E family transporter [Verrucomicrobia bacterium]|nr:MAG: AI-2E family transporter [Verrucomicrobiota bacterium]
MTEPEAPFFSPAQRKLIGSAAGLAAFLAIIALTVLIFVVMSRTVGRFSGMLWPLAIAGIVALMLRPVAGFLERRLHVSRVMSVIILYALVIIALAGTLLAILPAVISQMIDLVQSLPEMWRSASEFVQLQYPGWVEIFDRQMENETIRNIVDGGVEKARELAMSVFPGLLAAGGQVLGLFGAAAGLAIIPIYLFFFLQSDEEPTTHLADYLPFLKEGMREDVVFLAREFIGIVVTFFRGQLLIGLIMGVLLSIGFTLAGLKFGILMGMTIGILNIIPYLGTILGLSAALPTAFFQPEGGIVLVGITLGVFIAVQIIESYLLTPKIMGKSTGLHPVTIIIAIFFWGTALGGILGMVLAIPLTAFLVTVWRLAKRKYFVEMA